MNFVDTFCGTFYYVKGNTIIQASSGMQLGPAIYMENHHDIDWSAEITFLNVDVEDIIHMDNYMFFQSGDITTFSIDTYEKFVKNMTKMGFVCQKNNPKKDSLVENTKKKYPELYSILMKHSNGNI